MVLTRKMLQVVYCQSAINHILIDKLNERGEAIKIGDDEGIKKAEDEIH